MTLFYLEWQLQTEYEQSMMSKGNVGQPRSAAPLAMTNELHERRFESVQNEPLDWCNLTSPQTRPISDLFYLSSSSSIRPRQGK